MSYLGNKPSDVFPTSFTVTNATVEGAFTSQGIDDNADAVAITVDSNENVMIGTTSHDGNGMKLQVEHSSSATDGRVQAHGFSCRDNFGSVSNLGNGIASTASNTLVFATNSTERFRIGANGHLYATNNDGSLANLTLRNGSSSDSVDFVQCRDSGNNLELKIEGDGDVYNTNNTYGSLSDETLKENISNANSQWNDIKSVKVRNYSMIADGLDTANRIGVIAQELETAGMNGLVNQQEDGTKFVKYSVLYMKAVKALQEAMTRIETLETENTTQATQITDLINRVTALENA